MANQEQLAILKAGSKAWNRWRKKNPNLEINLQGANLRGADLVNANLTRVDLRGADLTGAYLRGATLTGAYLIGVNLREASLIKANLTRAYLGEADLTEAQLPGANLLSAILRGANLSEADLTKANLTRADLTRAYLINTVLNDASLVDANLTEADLEGVLLTGANLLRANLSWTDISRGHLLGANFTDADVRGANLISADLRGADLRGADFRGVNLRLANLEGIKKDQDTFEEHGPLRSLEEPEASPPEPAPPDQPTTDGPDSVDEVSFTAFYPKEGKVESWYTLLVYAHLLSVIEDVRRDARRFKDQMPAAKEVSLASSTPIPKGTEIAVVPSCEGVVFNPERLTFKWMESYHRTEFRFKADRSLADDAARGEINIVVDSLIVGSLRFAMLFNDADTAADREEHGRMYRAEDIFVSYSHKDSEVVDALQKAYRVLGFKVLRDRDELRSGQVWNEELMRMIERATIFQLYWSENSRQSRYCRQEWEHALKLNKDGFIHPVYWKDPCPDPPEELSQLHFAYYSL
jgi:uncharacterized protein YjbI with pentapeptide repeats